MCGSRSCASPARRPRPVFTAWDALYTFIGSSGDELYFQTTNGAPRGRMIAVNANASRSPPPGAPWCRRRNCHQQTRATSAAASSRVLARCAQPRAAVRSERHAGGRGARCPVSAPPRISRASGGKSEDLLLLYGLPHAHAHLWLDSATNTVTDFRTPKVPADHAYVTEQVFYNSKDGTRVPMFITRRKDVQTRRQPADAALRLRRIQRHGCRRRSARRSWRGSRWAASIAVANLRGGGEYGEEWHQAGTRLQQAERVR